MNENRLMIIDGNSIINRAFYGIRLLSNSEGVFTNAIYGFLNILFKYLEEEEPAYLCVAFDMKVPTFRHKEFEQYKAQRKAMPEELAMQLPILKQVLQAMNIPILELEGYEADDIIGTVSRICEEQSVECIVVTGDRDSLQLASKSTRIKLPITGKGATRTEEYDSAAVFEKYGISPQEFIDVKGLMGDASDNIPGVPGVGEKTAFSLIQQYKSIEKLYENIDTVNVRASVKESLIQNKEMAFLSKRLATIDRNIPMDFNIQSCLRSEYNKKELLDLFQKLEFRSLINKLQLDVEPPEVVEEAGQFLHITSKEEMENVLNKVKKERELRYILYSEAEEIVAVSVALNEKTAAYIDINIALPEEAVIHSIKSLFEAEDIKKIGHNIKDDIVLLHHYDIEYKGEFFDTMIGAYILNPARNTYHIDEIALELLGITTPSEESVLGKGKSKNSIKHIDSTKAVDFACKQVLVLSKLKEVIHKKIDEYNQHKLFYDVELPLVRVLADMQIFGFKVDKKKLTEFSKTLDVKIHELVQKIYNVAGEEFNINSTKQLGTVLFEKLNLPVVKKTKTGYSTDIEVLEKLKGRHEIIELLIEYRQLVKLKSTYADGLLNVINPYTGKIHSSFNQTVTVTGRISSTEPNLQNIPIKLELGREVRKMFIASDPEYVLLDADYSQIELRVLAHISEDLNLIDAFKNNMDVHTKTASQVFDVPVEEVTPLLRSRAKAVNFGIVYGMGDFSLAQDLGITRKEAKKYIDSYLERYPKVKEYMSTIVQIAKEQGYVTTLLNRRRYLPELQSKNYVTRSFGERVALNTPIQGSAADIIKIAMVNVHRELKKKNLKSRLILQVHDELIVETHKSEIEEVKKIVREQMENAVPLKVPLSVDMNIGETWYDAK